MLLQPPDLGVRLWQSFKCDTRLLLQVSGGGTFFIARDQSEVTNGSDGIAITQAATSSPAQPLPLVWQGSFWYRTDTVGTILKVVVIGKVGEPARDAGERGV